LSITHFLVIHFLHTRTHARTHVQYKK